MRGPLNRGHLKTPMTSTLDVLVRQDSWPTEHRAASLGGMYIYIYIYIYT